MYEGETSRSARMRSKEHWSANINKNPESVLLKHKEIDHKDEEMEVIMEITKTFEDPLTRQANEAVRIKNTEKSALLNSKSEFNHPPIARISVEKKFKKIPKKNQQTAGENRCGTSQPLVMGVATQEQLVGA